MYTIDASVWINSFDTIEPGHAISRHLLTILGTQAMPVIVPNLVLVEVAGAISRTRKDPVQGEVFAVAISQLLQARCSPSRSANCCM